MAAGQGVPYQVLDAGIADAQHAVDLKFTHQFTITGQTSCTALFRCGKPEQHQKQ